MGLLSFLRKLSPAVSPVETAEILFFGLGNPGKQYAGTRHNIGYRIADALAAEMYKPVAGRRPDAEYASGMFFESKKTLIIKPLTFMNRSGSAVAAVLRESGCPIENLLIIVDDYNLPIGKLRARRNGSDGGHNGLKSIIGSVGENFPRIRIGVGPLPAGISAIDFVLGPFTKPEEEQLAAVIPRAVEACLLFRPERDRSGDE